MDRRSRLQGQRVKASHFNRLQPTVKPIRCRAFYPTLRLGVREDLPRPSSPARPKGRRRTIGEPGTLKTGGGLYRAGDRTPSLAWGQMSVIFMRPTKTCGLSIANSRVHQGPVLRGASPASSAPTHPRSPDPDLNLAGHTVLQAIAAKVRRTVEPQTQCQVRWHLLLQLFLRANGPLPLELRSWTWSQEPVRRQA